METLAGKKMVAEIAGFGNTVGVHRHSGWLDSYRSGTPALDYLRNYENPRFAHPNARNSIYVLHRFGGLPRSEFYCYLAAEPANKNVAIKIFNP